MGTKRQKIEKNPAGIAVAIGVLWEPGPQGPGLLIARRRHDQVLAGFWEFPGGKIEPGENAQACVVREFMEELGLEVRVGAALGIIEHRYDYAVVRLHPFLCQRVNRDQQPQNLAVAEHRWIAAGELDQYSFPPANLPLLEELRRLVAGG